MTLRVVIFFSYFLFLFVSEFSSEPAMINPLSLLECDIIYFLDLALNLVYLSIAWLGLWLLNAKLKALLLPASTFEELNFYC